MEKHSYYLCRYLARSGIQVSLIHPEIDPKLINEWELLFSDIERKHIDLVEIDPPTVKWRLPGHYVVSNYYYSREAARAASKLVAPDFIYSKGLSGWYLARNKEQFATLKNIPLGVNAHGYEMFQPAGSFKTSLAAAMLRLPFRDLMPRVDVLFSYGGHITNLLADEIGIPFQNIIELPTGIDETWALDEPAKIEGPKRKFIFLGRYERRKGIQELSEVIKAEQWVDQAEFHFIGDIPEDHRLNLSNVFYHGAIRDVALIKQLLAGSHVLIVPSHSEGMPNVILEGMASGCAVIATDVGAVKLMVGPLNGWLIQPRKNDELREAIQRAATLNDHQLEELRKKSLHLVHQQFTWEQVIEQTISKLRAKVQEHSSRTTVS